METRSHLCSWTHSEQGYEFWLKAKPTVRGLGPTCEEAEETFIEALHDAECDTDVPLVFDPPLPIPLQLQEFLAPSILTIWGDEAFEQEVPRTELSLVDAERAEYQQWADKFYDGGYCRSCRAPMGPRTNTPLNLIHVGNAPDGGTVSIAGGKHLVLSEQFLSLLTDKERNSLQFREVICRERSRVTYYELIGPSGPAFVGLGDMNPQGGWVCAECGYRCFGYRRAGFDLDSFVALGDLPKPLSGIFTVGIQPNVELVATSERWSELVSKKGTKGIMVEHIGVVPENHVDREPSLAMHTSSEEERAKKHASWLEGVRSKYEHRLKR